MGMAASQARYLSLLARQSNLEYQGQQINQERSILSQQCTALYNSLLSMVVPTPPATTDFQTVKYTGEMGATKYSFDANSIRPNGGDTYSVTMQEQKHGDSLQKNTQIALVDSTAAGGFKGVEINTSASKTTTTTVSTGRMLPDSKGTKYLVPIPESTIEAGTVGTYYKASGNGYVMYNGPADAECYRLGTKTEGAIQVSEETKEVKDVTNDGIGFIQRSELSGIYVLENGEVRAATLNDFTQSENTPNILKFKSGVTYIQQSPDGKSYQAKGDVAGVTVGGKGVHKMTEEEKQKYGDAIANCGLQDKDGNTYGPDDFLMYYDDKGGAVFVLESDVFDGNNNAITYSYVPNGEFSKSQTYDEAKLVFDPTNGRITEIAIPNYDEDGNIASWTSISVKAETVVDEAAYNDAYAKYEYDTYLYDQKNKEINAKTEIIQQEDKNLELKLQRLDNERTQITTEIEAVEKVINDNIEGSYKTFSG